MRAKDADAHRERIPKSQSLVLAIAITEQLDSCVGTFTLTVSRKSGVATHAAAAGGPLPKLLNVTSTGVPSHGPISLIKWLK